MKTDPATRRWRLRAWNAEGELTHDSTYIGDAALGVALTPVEKDPTTHRWRVTSR